MPFGLQLRKIGNFVQSKLIELNNPVEEELYLGDSEPPFTLQDLKAAIPPECFVPSTKRSLFYFFVDVGIIGILYAIASYLDSWWVWPVFWLAQGTMFWALFVVGHDCGHGSFSRKKWVNNLIGHLAHIPILVPYHGWRISHRTHHKNTGNIDTDESWYPVTESQYREMPWYEKFVRFNALALLVAYPLYLFKGTPGKPGSHFLPSNPVFRPSEKWDVITSATLWTLMLGCLGWLTYQWGWMWLVKYYVGPYEVFVVWLALVTFLHHTDPEIPWYRGKDWYFLKGALSTIDHDYGFINNIHHNIGTHVAHHIFLSIPHYHLKTATEAIKPILGNYYRKSERSVFQAFLRSNPSCHFVTDTGAKVYYKSKKELQKG
jgi:omega-3 fatty acid desaturase (delta-15 desaturase)